jgi:hypothetical protein
MLQAASNILFKHYKKHATDFTWIKKYVSKCTNKDLIEDLKIFIG